MEHFLALAFTQLKPFFDGKMNFEVLHSEVLHHQNTL